MKIDSHIIFEIHRLFDLGYKQRKIARQLGISRPTVRKYLMNPERKRVNPVGRPSKLDPYCDLIHQMLEKDPDISAPVVLQHLSGKGFDGKVTIIRDYLRKQRGQKAFGQAFLHIEKAASFKAYGDEYIENILYQEMMPNNHHPPVQLKNEALNNIRLNEPRLADYDAYIIKRRRNDD